VFGARSVVLTDMDAVTDLLHRNVDSNRHLAQSDSSSLDVRVLDWNKRPLPSLSSDAFDVILAADCIYTHAPLKEFVAILSHYSTPNVRRTFFFSFSADV
jgi:predicted nicotinamide N-methyase